MITRLDAPRYLAPLLLCLLPGALRSADPTITITPKDASPGAAFEVKIAGAPAKVTTHTVKLLRNGSEFPAGEVAVSDVSAGGIVTVTATVPGDLAFGTYQVVVQLDRFQRSDELTVRPPGTAQIKLAKFDPDHTYSTETVWIARDPKKPAGGADKLRTVRLMLRGSGFLKDKPEGNTIWIDSRKQEIAWNQSCQPAAAGTRENGVAPGIRGSVNSSEQIELCHVPVPQGGKLLVAAGYGDSPSDPQDFTVYSMSTAPVALLSALITIALAGLVIWMLSLFKRNYQIAGENYKLRLLFLDPQSDTYSLSKFQFYFWTLAAFFAYAYLYISKVYVQGGDWPDIPGTLPGIIGISAGTAVGSQVVTAANGSKGAGEEKPSFLDFITSGGVVAADRVQMFLWTIFGVGAFCAGVLQKAPGTISNIAPVPDGMMYMMGLSGAGYLGGKMARKPGPVISEISVTPGESDRGLAKAASAVVDLPDFGPPSLQAKTDFEGLSKVTNANAQKAIDAFGSAIKAAGSVHTTTDLSDLLTSLAGFRRSAEDAAAAAALDFSASPAKATEVEAAAAQQAAAYLQDFSAGITQAISAAAVPAMEAAGSSGSVPRVIELRGANLSPQGTFEIDHAELPFSMLLNKDGQNAPETVMSQDGGTFATVLRLTIDPARLPAARLAQYQAWFGADGSRVLTLFNSDGQKADVSFSLPPTAPATVQ